MDQRGGLQCLAGGLLCHFCRGQPPQFVVHQNKQFVRCLWVACLHRTEELGDMGHRRIMSNPSMKASLRKCLHLVRFPSPAALAQTFTCAVSKNVSKGVVTVLVLGVAVVALCSQQKCAFFVPETTLETPIPTLSVCRKLKLSEARGKCGFDTAI